MSRSSIRKRIEALEKDLSRKERLQLIADAMAEQSLGYCESGCGQPYPDDVAVVGNHIVVATLDGGKEYAAPLLNVYTLRQAEQWYEEHLAELEDEQEDEK